MTSLPEVYGAPGAGPAAGLLAARTGGARRPGAHPGTWGCGNGAVALLAARTAAARGASWEIHGVDQAAIDPVRSLPTRYRETAAVERAGEPSARPGRAVPAVRFGDALRDARPPARGAHRRSALRPHGPGVAGTLGRRAQQVTRQAHTSRLQRSMVDRGSKPARSRAVRCHADAARRSARLSRIARHVADQLVTHEVLDQGLMQAAVGQGGVVVDQAVDQFSGGDMQHCLGDEGAWDRRAVLLQAPRSPRAGQAAGFRRLLDLATAAPAACGPSSTRTKRARR